MSDEFVQLVPLCRDHALTSYRWRNDPIVWKYTGNHPDRVITPEIELQWIEEVLKRENERRFAILVNSIYVGNVQLTGITTETAEFHIFIGDRTYWGKGIATIATKKILAYAQTDLMLKNVFLCVNPENEAAIHIYEHCGFQRMNVIKKMLQMVCQVDALA